MAKQATKSNTSRASKLNEGKVQVMRQAVSAWYVADTDTRKRFAALVETVKGLGIKSKDQFNEWRLEAQAAHVAAALSRNPLAKGWQNLKPDVLLAKARGILSSKAERTDIEKNAADNARTQIARLYDPCDLGAYKSKRGGKKNGAKGGKASVAAQGKTPSATVETAPIVPAPTDGGKMTRRRYVDGMRSIFAMALAFHNKHAAIGFTGYGELAEHCAKRMEAMKADADAFADEGEAKADAPPAKPRKARNAK